MKVKKILIVLIILIMISFTVQINIVEAALQSNGDTVAKKNRDTWMTQVRTMESLGGTLGLTETQNADLTSSSGSNSLDIHMQKNTEYGAMALLSASSYGNPNKIENGETTTGNETGVVIPYNKEWTAAQYTDLWNKNVAERYINYYHTGYGNPSKKIEERSGDAMLETQGWHGTTYFYAYLQGLGGGSYLLHAPYGLVRNIGDGIFGYNNSGGATGNLTSVHNSMGDRTANISNSYTSRAVIINGEGI